MSTATPVKRSVVVVGGASGIGLGAARAFQAMGDDVVIADRRHVEDLDALRRSSGDLGAELFLMDVARTGEGFAGQHDPQRLAVAFDTVLA